MKTVFLITGPTGAGKSSILNELKNASLERFCLVDCAGLSSAPAFAPPAPDQCDMVALDHVTHLLNAAALYEQARAWCEQHNKLLCIVASRRADLVGVATLPDSTVEMNIFFEDGKQMLRFSNKVGSQTYTPQSFISMASVVLYKMRDDANAANIAKNR